MAVLMSAGRNNLIGALHHILDTFLIDIDFSHGIFIKPNIVFAVGPKSGEITPPFFVKTLILAIKERYGNIDIIIGEGVAAGCDPSENFRVSGYAGLAHKLNVPLLDLNSSERKTVAWKFGKLELPKVALERTYINLPILKPSSVCLRSVALKNQKGLLRPAMKKQFHRLGLHEQIAELNAVVQPTLTIMDCSHFFGSNALLSGNNCGEIDATACQLLGIDEPAHVKLSRRAHVFAPGFSVGGDKIKSKRIPVHLKNREFKRLGRLRLWSNPQACTGCRAIFRDVQHDWVNFKNISGKTKLLTNSIKGAEIIMGLDPEWRKEYPTVICIGECTRRVAKEWDYIHIPGCPPKLDDLYDNLP
jgi:uncharacterized protein (DUF362 family)